MPEKKAKSYYLYLDAVTSHDLVMVKFSNAGKIIKQQRIANGVRTEKFLSELKPFILKTPGELKGIVVAQGTGSFTQSRLVCALANALAYSLSIKLAKVDSRVPVAKIVAKLPKIRWQKLLNPNYNGPGAS